ncbi:bifunctional tail domain protein [Escherichia coli 2875150]|uniref:phage head-binding domain-containing protein n=1 Tax=Escherichia coli TaxID=562 RepID=UPI0002C984EE|nr:phage head-binding domain-containing protein [Escherichia coli]ENB15369.1 bifunctional tail domain protein [Escherichia coli 2875150]
MTDSINANVVVSMPSQLFTMARSFKAVANGKIYIGKIDTDPVNPENQIQVYVENEDGSHVPVSQPIIINAAGYPVYNGQIAKFVTVQGHSMAVYDAYGAQQFYFPNVLKYDPDQLRRELAGDNGSNLVGGLPFDSMYGDLSTTEDNTMSINERLNWSRKTGKTVELPAGRFKVSGELELGGVKLRGRSIGFRNSDGTVLVGVGQDRLFNQSESTFPYFASTKLESLRIENVICGIEFGYLNRAEFEDIHIKCTGTGVRFGRAGNAGPQWNIMRRCTVESIGGSAIYMNGAEWCNNNTFELCFFESKENADIPAVVIDCAGGFGAIDNIFIGTEIASEGYGVRLKNAKATHFFGAYLECYGPSIWLNGTSLGTKVAGGVFARQRNNNATGINWAIYHESGNASIEIDKPYVVVSSPISQNGCGFIGYKGESPASGLVVDITSDPHTENIGGVAYTRYKDGLFSKTTKIVHGDQIIQSNSSPSLSLQHEDGTKKVEIYSNSLKDGEDFGATLKVNDISRMQFTADGKKILLPGQTLGVKAEENTDTSGIKTHRVQLLNESGAHLGYIHVFSK